jgi:hypothetical protein
MRVHWVAVPKALCARRVNRRRRRRTDHAAAPVGAELERGSRAVGAARVRVKNVDPVLDRPVAQCFSGLDLGLLNFMTQDKRYREILGKVTAFRGVGGWEGTHLATTWLRYGASSFSVLLQATS